MQGNGHGSALDIPISTVPITWRRQADNQISAAFGARGCAAHSPGVQRPGVVGRAITDGLTANGYRIAAADTPVGTPQPSDRSLSSSCVASIAAEGLSRSLQSQQDPPLLAKRRCRPTEGKSIASTARNLRRTPVPNSWSRVRIAVLYRRRLLWPAEEVRGCDRRFDLCVVWDTLSGRACSGLRR